LEPRKKAMRGRILTVVYSDVQSCKMCAHRKRITTLQESEHGPYNWYIMYVLHFEREAVTVVSDKVLRQMTLISKTFNMA
jgi:hypothetical protein